MAIGFFARVAAKFGLRFGAKAAAKTAGKAAAKVTIRQSLRRFGAGLGLGAIGAMGLSSYLSDGSLIPSLSSFNPFSEDFNLILFAIVAIVIIAFVARFRK